MTENEHLSQAVARWATKMAEGLRTQASAYETLAASLNDPRTVAAFEPAADLHLTDRPGRQALLLAAVQMRAKQLKSSGIPRTEWLRLAEHFGYDRRGTAGFFRRSPDGSMGLLMMDTDNNTVSLGDAGLKRIDDYKEEVANHKSEIEASVKNT